MHEPALRPDDRPPAFHPGPLRLVHWGTAGVLALSFGLVLALDGVDGPGVGVALLALHRSLGVVVLAATVLRAGVRLGLGAAEPKAAPWERAAARAVHLALYGLLFLVPVLGVLLTQARGLPVSPFGLFALPTLVGRDRDLADLLEDWHGACAWTLAVLVGLHVAAALHHRFQRRDGVMAAMWPPRLDPRPQTGSQD